MKLPSVTIKQLLEAGVHLGHKTFRWNPKMSKYIFGSKDSIHIIDLVQTLEMTSVALQEIHKCIASGGKILFVSTKKQATDTISSLARDTSQFYVNHRWLGGMLTNWKTISNSIKRYKKLSEDLKKESTGFTKKEVLKMGIQRDKLERSLGGIADMKKTPNMIFVIDTNVESLAVKEAQKLWAKYDHERPDYKVYVKRMEERKKAELAEQIEMTKEFERLEKERAEEEAEAFSLKMKNIEWGNHR